MSTALRICQGTQALFRCRAVQSPALVTLEPLFLRPVPLPVTRGHTAPPQARSRWRRSRWTASSASASSTWHYALWRRRYSRSWRERSSRGPRRRARGRPLQRCVYRSLNLHCLYCPTHISQGTLCACIHALAFPALLHLPVQPDSPLHYLALATPSLAHHQGSCHDPH